MACFYLDNLKIINLISLLSTADYSTTTNRKRKKEQVNKMRHEELGGGGVWKNDTLRTPQAAEMRPKQGKRIS